VVGGCGRTGAAIVDALSKPGRTIRILDVLTDAFDLLPEETVRKGMVIPYFADMTLESDLRATGVQDADVFIATAGSDAVNIMSSQIARHILGVRSVICRLDDPVKRDMYGNLDLTTISHTEILLDLALQRI
jgi:trk system potassium uptake protein TrkA